MPSEVRPWFAFFPADWLSSSTVTAMSAEARGVYINLLCYCWRDGAVPNNDADLAALARVTVPRWRKLRDIVLRPFTLTERGWINERLEEERGRGEAASEHGRVAADARWKRKKTSILPVEPGPCPSGAGVMPEHSPSNAQVMHSEVRSQKSEEEDSTPPSPSRGTGSAKKLLAPGFDLFWGVYPRKVGKAAAEAAWRKLNPSSTLVEFIVGAVDRQSRSESWRRDRGQFIPHASTWLNGRRWEDEIQLLPPGRSSSAEPLPTYTDPEWCHHTPRCNSRAWHEVLCQRESTSTTEGVA